MDRKIRSSPRAVQLYGFEQLLRNVVEKVSHQKQVPWRQRGRKDVNPDRILQMEIPCRQNVAGHHSAAEQHRKVEKQGELRRITESAAGQGIRGKAGDQKTERRAGDRDKNGDEVRVRYRIRAEDRFVCVKRVGFGQEPVSVAQQRRFLRKGARDHEQERIQAQGGEDDRKGIE
ncbi:hypothetical protein [Cohnella rhizosphaerae]|uniref:Uncharacterized protein n=1 Tax=Cohnella rhizosphaerae TaxID=1457232 RepID=A0A9X4L194_9BACL|nr:hypothetical protein [Cohnella rhizosphaerae]MDG0814358.1 hypothetical protein [Cohnella rhizosphaerae]